MASSPPYNRPSLPATSPSYSPITQLPPTAKRRQSDMPSAAPSSKRRKASMLSMTSTSSHPLRQTSFPPENSAGEQRFSRSVSVESSSLVSGVSGSKKKRGRKPKNKADDDTSLVGGRAKSAVSGASGRRGRGSRDASIDDYDDEEGGGDTAVAIEAHTDDEAMKESELKAVLYSVLDPEQSDRLEAWRASKLADSVVRRIVNQTLSQSAPQSVILAVRSVAKIFIGEMIEGARRVQTQWQEVDEESKTLLPTPPPTEPGEEKVLRGPLLPDHLREAYRRHKLSGEDSLAGQLGLWQLQASSGVERFGNRCGGKRLFK